MFTQVKTPNYTPGRQGNAVKYVVIHWIVGNLSAADAVFRNDATDTSAHYGIENTTVHQYVKETDTAYHAGTWQANLQSIGIEHSAAPGRPASAKTYETSISLIADICKRYKLSPDTAIVPHNKFFNTACPGTMDINKIKAGVKAKLKGASVATKASAAQVTKAYKDILERAADAGGIKHYTNNGMTEAQVRADLMKSAERKKLEARKAAQAKATAAAEAAKKAAEAAAKAKADAEAKAKAEEEAKKNAIDKYAEENNNLLKQILALLKSIFNR